MKIIVPRKVLREISISLFASAIIIILSAAIANLVLIKFAHRLETSGFTDTNRYFIYCMRVTWLMFVGSNSIASIGCALWLHTVQKRAKVVENELSDTF
jgi:hypothetical protein